MQRRGCFRTSFEFARLLYALDPWNDPHGALLHLDFLPFKAHQTDWLLSVWDIFTSWKKQEPEKLVKRMDPTLLPGWNYSRALALHIKEKGEKSKVRVYLLLNKSLLTSCRTTRRARRRWWMLSRLFHL